MFGWQKPCYLLQEGYAQTFQELLETTQWENYGRKSGNSQCADCMVHSGYEPSSNCRKHSGRCGDFHCETVRMVLLGMPADHSPSEPPDRPRRSLVQRIDSQHPFPEPADNREPVSVAAFQLPIVTP